MLRPSRICGFMFVLKPALSAGDLDSCVCFTICQVGFASGNHFGSRLAIHLRKPTKRNGSMRGSDAPMNPAEMKEWVTKLERPDVAPPAPRLQDTASPWENVEAPLPPSVSKGSGNLYSPVSDLSRAGLSETTVPHW